LVASYDLLPGNGASILKEKRISGEAYDVNKQTVYTAPKSTNESKAQKSQEPTRGEGVKLRRQLANPCLPAKSLLNWCAFVYNILYNKYLGMGEDHIKIICKRIMIMTFYKTSKSSHYGKDVVSTVEENSRIFS